MTVRTAAVVVLLVLVVLCNLRPCALLLQEEVMAVLPVSEVQRRVFDEDEEGGKGQSWLLVFHHSPRPELVYEALDIITLAMWIRQHRPRPSLRLGLISCSDPDQRTDLFFPGRCNGHGNATRSRRQPRRHRGRKGTGRRRSRRQREPTPLSARAFLVVMPGAESILEAEEVSGFAADPAEATVEAAGRRIGGQWRDAVYQRPESLTISNYLLEYSSSATAIEATLGTRRRLITVRAGVVPDLSSADGAGALEYTMARDGSVLWNDDGGGGGGECGFSANWQLTVLRSSVCGAGAGAGAGAAPRPECDVGRSMFPALLQMGARGEKFSVRGFMDKFARLCHKITNRLTENGSSLPPLSNATISSSFSKKTTTAATTAFGAPKRSTTFSPPLIFTNALKQEKETQTATTITTTTTTTTTTATTTSTATARFTEALLFTTTPSQDEDDFFPYELTTKIFASQGEDGGAKPSTIRTTTFSTSPLLTTPSSYDYFFTTAKNEEEEEGGHKEEERGGTGNRITTAFFLSEVDNGDSNVGGGGGSNSNSNPGSPAPYPSRYMDMMDALTSNPAMVRFRLGQIFADFPDDSDLSRLEEQQRRTQLRHRTRLNRWRVSVENFCREHHARGAAFVKNHMRDVAYAVDLLGAVAGSLDFRDLLREDEERLRLKRLRSEEPSKTRQEEEEEDEEDKIRRRQGQALRRYLSALRELLPPLHRDDRREFRMRQYLTELEDYVSAVPPSSFSLRRFLLAESILRSALDPFQIDGSGSGGGGGVHAWPWRGCADGGFPCALWQLLHLLTVEQAHRWKWRQIEQPHDLLSVIFDYADTFYRASSRSMFLRFFRLDPPDPGFDPEEVALWLWNAHNQMNLLLYDHEMSRAVSDDLPSPAPAPAFSSLGGSRDICKGTPFPSRDICPLCYRKKRKPKRLFGKVKEGEAEEDRWTFRSGRVILRYLYAVYTRDKVI